MSNETAPVTHIFSWSGSGGVIADSELVFYVDESGNTGAKHLDKGQPYYLTAGWLLRKADVARGEDLVARALDASERVELKGSKMLKTGRGTRIVHKLIVELLRFCTPILVIVEKRYALWTRAVETFVYHPAGSYFGPHHVPDRGVSRAFATALASLPAPVAWHVDQYLRAPTTERAFACIDALHPALVSAGRSDLAREVANAQHAPARWWDPDENTKRSHAPNVMGFNTLLQSVEMLGIRCGQHVSFVHDRTLQFEKTYGFYHQFAAINAGLYPEMFERAGCPGTATRVGSPHFADSKEELLVQAADVLCGSSLALLRELSQLPAASLHHKELAMLLLWGFVEPDLKPYFFFIGSDSVGEGSAKGLVSLYSGFR